MAPMENTKMSSQWLFDFQDSQVIESQPSVCSPYSPVRIFDSMINKLWPGNNPQFVIWLTDIKKYSGYQEYVSLLVSRIVN